MESTQQLVSALQDCQAELTAALARIEAYRIREEYLVGENFRLQEQLKRVLGEDVGSTTSEPTSSNPECAGHSNYRLREEYPIILHTKKGRVAGSLSASSEYLEFLESKARITANQFVGMKGPMQIRSRGKGDEKSPSLMSKAWPWTFFGKSKTTEDVTLQGDVKDGRSLDGEEPKLKRSSWSGPVGLSNKDGLTKQPKEKTEQKSERKVWTVLWKKTGKSNESKQIEFEASLAAQSFISRQIKRWKDAASNITSAKDSDHQNASSSSQTHSMTAMSYAYEGAVVPAKYLIPNGPFPGLSSPSELLTEHHVRSLTSAVPVRHRHATWSLVYSTGRDGISLQTLYRKTQGYAPTVLVLKDSAEFIFGCFCSEAWKIFHRFYGTGETFIFQLEPDPVYYTWKQESSVTNNYFMFASQEYLAVGGTGHYALRVDSELLNGTSGPCDTFGSPCIASTEVFKIMKLELWALG